MREALTIAYKIEPQKLQDAKVKDLNELVLLMNRGLQFEGKVPDFTAILENLTLAQIDLLAYTLKINIESERLPTWAISLIQPLQSRAAHFIPSDVLTTFPARLIKPILKFSLFRDHSSQSEPQFWQKFEHFLGTSKINELPLRNIKNTINALQACCILLERPMKSEVLQNILNWSLTKIPHLIQVSSQRSLKLLIYSYIVYTPLHSQNTALLNQLLKVISSHFLQSEFNYYFLDIILALVYQLKRHQIQPNSTLMSHISEIIKQESKWNNHGLLEVGAICFYAMKLSLLHQIPDKTLAFFENFHGSRQVIQKIYLLIFAGIVSQSEISKLISYRKKILESSITNSQMMGLVEAILEDDKAMQKLKEKLVT